MYAIDNEKLTKRPEIRIGDRVFTIDNRLSTFEVMRRELNKAETAEMAVVIAHGLGHDAYLDIVEMDLPYGVMEEIVMLILAGIQGLEVDEAKTRFCHGLQ
ncbi:MAG: hypothetical protein FWE21_10305 [Defluviitaleaceae bacterium]|nr:hypothetical protein [Defluviitaleaceae bacterium]